MTKPVDFDTGDVVVPVWADSEERNVERIVDSVYSLVMYFDNGEESPKKYFVTFEGDPLAYAAEEYVLADRIKMKNEIALDELF